MSRLSPDLSTEVIKAYASSIIEGEVSAEKLNSKYTTYSSFVITCDLMYKDKLLSPDEWAEGVMIRPFDGKLENN